MEHLKPHFTHVAVIGAQFQTQKMRTVLAVWSNHKSWSVVLVLLTWTSLLLTGSYKEWVRREIRTERNGDNADTPTVHNVEIKTEHTTKLEMKIEELQKLNSDKETTILNLKIKLQDSQMMFNDVVKRLATCDNKIPLSVPATDASGSQ